MFQGLRGVVVPVALCAFGLAVAFLFDGGPAHPRVVVVPQAGEALSAHLVFPRPPAPAGLAHYAEHLAWLSAAGRGMRGADRHSNAWTGAHAVGYWQAGGREDLPELIATLAGVFAPIDLPRRFAEEERGIIRREYDFRLANSPDAQAAEAIDAFLYAGNDIAVSLIGTPEEIAALDYDAARAFHEATHRPEAAVLVVVGDTTARQVRRALRGLDLPAASAPASTAPFAPAPFVLAAPDAVTLREVAPAAAPRLVWRRVVALSDPVPFDLLETQAAFLGEVLRSTLPGGIAGPLRFDAALARSLDIELWPLDEGHVEMLFVAAPDAGLSLAGLAAAFEATLAEVARAGIPAATHERVLTRFDRSWPDWDHPDETAGWMADYVLDRVGGLRMPLPQRELEALAAALAPEDVTALLRRIAGEGRTAIACIGPEETLE